jgi:hypothetical protein
VRPELGREPSDLTASELLDERSNRIPEETEHHVLGQVECLDRKVGFEHGVARRVEVEDRGVVWVGQGMLKVQETWALPMLGGELTWRKGSFMPSCQLPPEASKAVC